MKGLTILAAILPLASAAPSLDLRPIDPIQDSDIYARHLAVLEAQRNCALTTPAIPASDLSDPSALEKRFIPYIALLGISINAGAIITRGVGKNLRRALKATNEEIWRDNNRCRMYFQNVAGGGCHHNIMPRKGLADKTLNNWGEGCSWHNPSEDDPAGPPVFIGEAKGIGKYSVQWTATDRAAWGGIPDTVKCGAEALCNPQVVFYRDDYEIILNTWRKYINPDHNNHDSITLTYLQNQRAAFPSASTPMAQTVVACATLVDATVTLAAVP